MKNQWSLVIMVVLLLAGCGKKQSDQLDVSELRNIPVFVGAGKGRAMPWDSRARSLVRDITEKESPKIGLVGEFETEDAWRGSTEKRFVLARKMFDDGKARKFDPSELMLSWHIEPDGWAVVPFLPAAHEELRERLGLPAKNEENNRLLHVSPMQLGDKEVSKKARKWEEEIRNHFAEAKEKGEEYELNDAEKKFNVMKRANFAFWEIAFSGQELRSVELHRVQTQFQMAQRVANSFLAVDARRNPQSAMRMRSLPIFRHIQAITDKEHQTTLTDAMIQVGESVNKIEMSLATGSVMVKDIEPEVARFVEATETLRSYFSWNKANVFQGAPSINVKGKSSELSATQIATRAEATQLASSSLNLANHAAETQLALFDNGASICVIPALSARALERERNKVDHFRPWLSLNAVRFGSDAALKDYDLVKVREVAANFKYLAEVYVNRTSSTRADDFDSAARGLAKSLRELGERTARKRESLELKKKDVELMEHTDYPPFETIAREVRYNLLDPFMYCWILGLAAVLCFSLSFGVIRKPMFWSGMGIMAIVLLWTCYGFYLRIMISQWAPITNMYTTVIWVPFIVMLLGMWLALHPVVGPSLKNGWRLSAIPGSWEATPLTDHNTLVMKKESWNTAGLIMLVPRIGLMTLMFWMLAVAPYSAGGRTIINLLPNSEISYAGKTSASPILTWAVGILTMTPTVWFLPRAVLSLLTSMVLVPLHLFGDGKKLIAEVYSRRPFVLGASIASSVLFMLAHFGAQDASVLNESFDALMPVLRDNFWLTIHVITIVSSYGAGLLAWVLGIMSLGFYLFGRYRNVDQRPPVAGHRPANERFEIDATQPRRPPEQCATLATYQYKAIQVAVLLLAAGTILGGLWADVAWGRFWGWDPKEIWALISLLVYLAILHGRYAGWFGNFGLSVGSSLGFGAIVWAWYGVNFLMGAGMHSYGSGSGGAWAVMIAMGANVTLLLAALIRYNVEGMIGHQKTIGPVSAAAAGDDDTSSTTDTLA